MVFIIFSFKIFPHAVSWKHLLPKCTQMLLYDHLSCNGSPRVYCLPSCKAWLELLEYPTSSACRNIARLNRLSHTTATTLRQHCTSWRSDGSPPCLDGASHGWVPVNTHSTPALTSVRRPWMAHSLQAPQAHNNEPTTKLLQYRAFVMISLNSISSG